MILFKKSIVYRFKSCHGEVHLFLMKKKEAKALGKHGKQESEENIYSEQKKQNIIHLYLCTNIYIIYT